jgi:hypothetical protein
MTFNMKDDSGYTLPLWLHGDLIFIGVSISTFEESYIT